MPCWNIQSDNKAINLMVRPIHHRLEDRVRAHLLVCMLAYYIEWHIRDAWRELTFTETDQAAKKARDPADGAPVAPARRSQGALHKAHTCALDDGTPVHSIDSLMSEKASIVRNTCRARDDAQPGMHTFEMDTGASEKQRRALGIDQCDPHVVRTWNTVGIYRKQHAGP